MASVFLVTSGEYSHYGIRAAFATREAAEEHARALNESDEYGHAEVEEWEIRHDQPRRLVEHWRTRSYEIDREPVVRDGDREVWDYETDALDSARVDDHGWVQWHDPAEGLRTYRTFTIKGTDEPAVIRLLNERSAEVLAEAESRRFTPTLSMRSNTGQ